MIELTNLAKQKIWINPSLLKMIELAPDTILCFMDGSRLAVLESPLQVRQQIINLQSEQNKESHRQLMLGE